MSSVSAEQPACTTTQLFEAKGHLQPSAGDKRARMSPTVPTHLYLKHTEHADGGET